MTPLKQVSSKELTEILISETSRILGQDASFLAPHMKVRRRPTAVPNWDANCDVFAGAIVAEAFGEARDYAKARYELQ